MKTIRIIAAAAAICALTAAGCSPAGNYVVSDGAMLGTTFHVCAELPSGVSSSDLYAEMMSLDRRARASMSIFDEESLLSRLNRNETDSADLHIINNLTLARRISCDVDRHYDITVKPLTDALGFARGEALTQPNTDSLLQFIGPDKWHIEGFRVVKHDPRVQFDLNSIAKGYTVDLAAARLEALGSVNYIVEIGGEIRCRGVNRAGDTWTVGIDAPYEGNMIPGRRLCGAVMLHDRALATSGNYRRYHVDGQGNKTVHTIDPLTGRGRESRLLSATVVARECAVADALATTFMAAGADRALELAAAMRDTTGVFFILDDGRGGYEFYNTIDGYER